MLAEIKPRIDQENRTKLETVIPLATPFIVNVDPADTCNFKCHFCPTGDRELMKSTPGRNHGPMSMDLFKKIVDDLNQFSPKIRVLRLYKEGEPLLNPNFADMVRYANEQGCSDRIDTTTNASLLTPKLVDKLAGSGLTRMNISIEGMNKSQYKSFAGVNVDFEKIVRNVKYMYENRGDCEMIVKINGDSLSSDDKEKFYDTFGNMADGVFIEHVMECWPEFELRDGMKAHDSFGIYGQKIQEVQACPYIFYSFSINSNGSVSACFLDWARKLEIGNVNTQSIKDIWQGTELRKLQMMMLRKKRLQHPVCGKCGQMTHGMPDNIDKYTDTLIQKVRLAGKNENI